MINSYLKPDYLFEASWEVCNKRTGVYTVLATKAVTLVQQFQNKLIYIGPELYQPGADKNKFIPDASMFPEWQAYCKNNGIPIRIGHWDVIGLPTTVLVDFSNLIPEKNEILKTFWDDYKVDSLSGQWDYIEPVLFGYAAGKIIEYFVSLYITPEERIVTHFNDWLTGAGLLYLKKNVQQAGTILTIHDTVVGRAMAAKGEYIYDNFDNINSISKAQELGVISKYSLEKKAAQAADCFTTVSEITARECSHFLEREIDVLTPNGFEENFVPKGEAYVEKRKVAQIKLRQVSEALLGYKLADDAMFMATSGRYEFRNKGTDLLLDALKLLSEENNLKREIVVFVMIPANIYGPRVDLKEKLDKGTDVKLDNPFLTHGLDEVGYDPIINKIKNLHLKNGQDNKIKVIFTPSFLNGYDGIFQMPYYDLLIGMDLTIFPSYYEPWSYTPLESMAFGIPTVTTSLTGFGNWVKAKTKGIIDGIEVIERNDENSVEATKKIAQIVLSFSQMSNQEKTKAVTTAQNLTQSIDWEQLIKNYYKAFDIAIKAVNTRTDLFIHMQKDLRIQTKPETSPRPMWKKIVVKSKLPQDIQKLHDLSRNLWWTWNYEAIELFESINPKIWREVGKNPILLLEQVPYNELSKLAQDSQFVSRLNQIYDKLTNYLEQPFSHSPAVAYFSMEYGLTTILKIYSGGLGVLAGDYMKEASDSRVNMVGVGLMYRYGYFKQALSLNGEQQAIYEPQEFSNLPLEEVRTDDGQLLMIDISFPGRLVKLKVWKAMVGRIPLYLLDSDHALNEPADRTITHNLYGGDWENRLKQEIILGMGGIRLLNELKIESNIYHCNEGHAALINVQRLINLIEKKLTYSEAMEVVKSTSLFTTHTPVPAGHDKFDEDMFRVYLRHIPELLTISWDEFMDLGREYPGQAGEKFSMSVLAAKTSQEMNGVSWLHGEVSKEMFHHLWEGYAPEELHINYVTNGVHYGSWTSKECQKLYNKHFDQNFLNDVSNKDFWSQIYKVDSGEIWQVRRELKKKLFDYIKSTTEQNMANTYEDPSRVVEIMNKMNENALTIGFARRFATYKRAHLLFTDLDRLSRLVNNPEKPVQFIFAGKAHPADGGGQGLIKRIIEVSRRPEFIGKIIFVENYDMELGKRLTSGVDVWLNTPTRPLEASGTSGQKAELNGVLNFSVLDGWWYEGYKPHAGWNLTDKQTFTNTQHQDELDAATIYNLFENEIIPLYYDRENEVPNKWIEFVKNSIANIAPEYTTKRMMNDYLHKFYQPQYQRSNLLKNNNYAKARELAAWKKKVSAAWNNIEVTSIDMPDISAYELGIGEDYDITVTADLKNLDSSEISFEMVFADGADDNIIKIVHTEQFVVKEKQGSVVTYYLKHKLNYPGVFKFGIRMYPSNPMLPHRQDFGLIRWI